MNLVYTNSSMSSVGYLDFVGFDESMGDSGNQVQVKLHSGQRTELAEGSIVYEPGTEIGGIIDCVESKDESDGERYAYYSGPSWSGRLMERIVKPPSGKDHYTMSGEANAAIDALLAYLDLDYLFAAPDEPSGLTLSHDVDRFADGFTALRKAASSCGKRLSLAYDNAAKKVVVRFADRTAHGGYSSESSPISVKIATAVNHLVCAGTGELQKRVVLDLYIGEDGSVQQTQYYKGADRKDALYENTSADKAKLKEEGAKKLKELQSVNEVGLSVEDSREDVYQLDDVIFGIDPITGIKASSTIGKKVVSVDRHGYETYRYEPSEGGGASLSTETSGSSGGGASYSAGDGIRIENYTISADVTESDLNAVSATATNAATQASNASAAAGAAQQAAEKAQETADGKADRSHTHVKADITDFPASLPASDVSAWAKAATKPTYTASEVGAATKSHTHAPTDLTAVVPVSKGGTGASSAKAARYNLFNDMGFELPVVSDNHPIVMAYVAPSTANGAVYRLKASQLWEYIKTKASAVFAAINHTHSYAGSSTAGGAANSAKKWDTPRKITLTGAVEGSATMDGSQDVTITVEGDQAAAGFLAAHPVGSIYATSNPENPAVTHGGAWEPLPSADSFKFLRTK